MAVFVLLMMTRTNQVIFIIVRKCLCVVGESGYLLFANVMLIDGKYNIFESLSSAYYNKSSSIYHWKDIFSCGWL